MTKKAKTGRAARRSGQASTTVAPAGMFLTIEIVGSGNGTRMHRVSTLDDLAGVTRDVAAMVREYLATVGLNPKIRPLGLTIFPRWTTAGATGADVAQSRPGS